MGDKVFLSIAGKPMLWYSLKTLHEHPLLEEVVVVVRKDKKEEVKQWLLEWDMPTVWVTEGSATRQESAERGMKKLGTLEKDDVLLMHNAANPFVTADEITMVLHGARNVGAAAVGHPVVDTLKRVDRSGHILETVDRSDLWHAQTPQAIRADLYQRALEKDIHATDEVALAEALNIQPSMFLASVRNRKVTTAGDIETVRLLLEEKVSRTGIGMDSHRFHRTHRGLKLGGIALPDHPAFEANSDGDVMLHALANALLQAMGAEGSLSSVADPLIEKEGITDSRKYVEEILGQIKARGFSVGSVGFQVEGSSPRIDPLIPQLKQNLGALLRLAPDAIGVTATTGEDLTPFGRGEGLQCWATVTLR
jgi:2-C-methyl-D-erythritol 4-phosphate cytidylyltransferase/2-C-methyl-D-erythritol 2,4-cyclodiphosphate synthase